MPTVSLVVATNRTSFWARFCDHLSQNAVDFEMLFVGPLGRTEWAAPCPVRYLKTDLNPAQCWELGARHARGEFLCLAPDDVCYSAGFLDAAVAALARSRHRDDLASARFYLNGRDCFGDMRLLCDITMPMIPVGGLLRTASHHRLGGVDRRFHAVVWDMDLYMRFYEAGGRTHLLNGHICNELGVSKLYVDNRERDVAVLKDLWYRDGVPQLTRNDVVQPYPAIADTDWIEE